MSRTAVPLCHCARCWVDQAGLGAGPYTPAEYALIAPATVSSTRDDPVSEDPGVKAAQLALREAQEAHAPLYQAWLEAVAAHRREEMATDSAVTDGRGGLWSFGPSGGCGGRASWPAGARRPGRPWTWPGGRS